MRGFARRLIFLGPGLTWLSIFLLVPLGVVFVYSFFRRGVFGGIVHEFTWRNYDRLTDSLFLNIFVDSVRIAGITTILALLLGYPAAYFIATRSARWQTPLLALVVMPFWTNYLIRTYAWIVLLNREGIINRFLESLGIIDEPLGLLYNEFAIIIGLLYGYLPFMVLPLYASLERLNPELREASEDLGANPFVTFFNVTLPLTIPGVVAGSIFVFVPSLGNFFVPELLGGGQKVMVGNLIQSQYLRARDWPMGSAMAFGVMGVVLFLLIVQAMLVRRVSRDESHA